MVKETSTINLIVAVDENYLIGKGGDLPWRIKEDLKFFKEKTKGSVVIMGRRTYESIGKPLPNRINIVLSKTLKEVEGVEVVGNLKEGLTLAKSYNKDVFIIGGKRVYEMSIPYVEKAYVSFVKGSYNGDTYLPRDIFKGFKEIDSIEYDEFTVRELVKK